MHITKMHIDVKLLLDKSTSLQLPAYEPEEIDNWLNRAILKFVKTKYSGSNVKGESFEQTQARLDDLRTLVLEVPIVPVAGSSSDKPNSFLATLPTSTTPETGYMYRVGEEVTISFTDSVTGTTVTKRQGVTECTSDTYANYIDNPYSEHRLYLKEAKPLRLIKGNTVELVTDGNYTITGYYLRYIKYPATVSITSTTNVNCDLPDHTHPEIVEMCVAMMLENIESIRYQSFKSETSMPE